MGSAVRRPLVGKVELQALLPKDYHRIQTDAHGRVGDRLAAMAGPAGQDHPGGRPALLSARLLQRPGVGSAARQ